MLEGFVSKVFHESANGFVVARLNVGNRCYTILGDLCGGLKKGDTIRLNDYRMENHKDFGEQVRVLSWEKRVPTTMQGVLEFFRSGLIKGVSEKRANCIVGALGENALKIIGEKGPEVLEKIPGIGSKMSQSIYGSVLEHQRLHGIVQELSGAGMSFKMVMKAYGHFGPGVADIVRSNPYRLVDLNMVSFTKADVIARNFGVEPHSGFRVAAALDHVFERESQRSGHCYLLFSDLVTFARELLGGPVVDDLFIGEIIELQVGNGRLKLDGLKIYSCSHYNAEVVLSRALRSVRGCPLDLEVVSGAVLSCEGKSGVALSAEQKKAVEVVFRNGLSVLTGGPGTGKTQTVKDVIEAARFLGFKRIFLCAPTGRAAKVLTSVTGLEAQTLHRMLDMQPGGRPRYDADNPLPCDLVVVDEASMLDLFLARDLFEALPPAAHVLLVGDKDQLPPVGPGNVFKDLLSAGAPHVNLTHIYRQSESSAIILNAHAVNGGAMPDLSGSNGFYFIEKSEPSEVVDAIGRSFLRLVQKGYSLQDIQVLSPMKKGETGTENLNRVLQEISNPASPGKGELTYGRTIFRVGDKVMQVKNDYTKQVFNGEMGVVAAAGPVFDSDGMDEEGLTVKYNGRDVHYARDELFQLALAYAVTVHKSQGCEYPAVILALTTQHYIMLARNLVYTAISRAKNVFVLVGTRKALAIAVKNNKVVGRNTSLSERLQGAFVGQHAETGFVCSN